MQRTPVESSHIAAIGYDPNEFLLEIEFDDGAVYQYRRVPVHIWAGLAHAASKGGYFHQYIRDRYEARKVATTSEPTSQL